MAGAGIASQRPRYADVPVPPACGFSPCSMALLQDVRHASPCPAAAFRAQDVRSWFLATRGLPTGIDPRMSGTLFLQFLAA